MTRAAHVAVVVFACSAIGCSREHKGEVARREAFAYAHAVDAGAARLWGVSSNSQVHFEEGFSLPMFDPEGDFRNHAFRYVGQRARARVRAHDGPMRLVIHGWINEKVIRSKPVVSLYLRGTQVGSSGVVESGTFSVGGVVPPFVTEGEEWVDVDLVVSTVAFYWAEPPELRVALVTNLEWSPLSP